MKDYGHRVEALRAVEALCYSLCIHILVEESLAWNAARMTLIDLFEDEQYWQSDSEEQKRLVRKKAIARALEQAAKKAAS
ncbi:hypothetical protein [Cohnella hongkongensis]|uniref:Uncharacterized protein n=1 Tax=Cohnella hongkongensis TaxID=178337 RepID=A0ABV9FG64_9BACL